MTRQDSSWILLLLAGLAMCLGLSPMPNAAGEPFLGSEGSILPNPATPFTDVSSNGVFVLLTGDFNEDGFPDLATSDNNGFLILLGHGDCTFTSTFYPVFGRGLGSIADFNEDGHQDLVFAHLAVDVRVLLGNGDGTFGAPIFLDQPGVVVFAVAVADFDNDNNQDVVSRGGSSGDPYIFFGGNGNGMFSDAVLSNGGGGAWDIGVGDFDENGFLDVVSRGNVWLGSGNGTFTPFANVASGDNLRVFDFDGDTHLDIAAVSSNTDIVGVSLGNGDGTFAATAVNSAGFRSGHLLVHDTDADGNADLLVGHRRQMASDVLPNEISVLPGNGDGTFDPKTEIPLFRPTGPMVIADFDQDGNDDLATFEEFNRLIVLRGRSGGGLGADVGAVRTADPHGAALAAAFGDLNNDGFKDVVRVRDGLPFPVTVMLGDGNGAFSVSTVFSAAGSGVADVAIADLDNDTQPDVIVTNTTSNDASIFPGNGDGTFLPMITMPLIPGPGKIVTGQFNSDADIDLAVLGMMPSPSAFIFTGNGDATFSPNGLSGVGTDPVSVQSGDFDENGVTDLVVGNQGSSDLSVLLGVGDGTFQPEVRYAVAAMDQNALTIADVNDDGHDDLLLEHNEVLYGLGDGTFAGGVDVLADSDPTDTRRIGDLSGDGLVDLFGREASLRLGQVDGTFGDSSLYGFPTGEPLELILEDIDQDGRVDVLVTTADEIVTLLNTGRTPLNFLDDKITLRWPDVDDALSYNVYRGSLSDLTDGDVDGLPDSGYGTCQNAADPDLTDLIYLDASTPASNTGYFYLIAIEDGIGERWLGTTSAGLPRSATPACP